MATAGKVKVGNKDVFIKDVTYDDLVILYQQYIDTYHEMPLAKKCDIEHNMPYRRKITSLLNENNITEKEFLSQFENRLSFKKNVKRQIEIYKSKFPISINELTYNICGNIDVTYKNGGHHLYWFNLVDNYGYKYYVNYNNVVVAQRNQTQFKRFFKGNKYTYENINLFCKINKIDLHIDGKGLSYIGLATTPLSFYNSNNEETITTWNRIRKIASTNSDSDCIKVKTRIQLEKKNVENIIKEKEKELGRPLLQSDFEHTETTQNSVGIRTIFNIWGNFTNMINDLGLQSHNTYFKPNSKYFISHEEVMKHIRNVCDIALSENRNIVFINEFLTDKISNDRKLYSHCRLENTTLRDYIKKCGCILQSCGVGFNYIFDDGEKVVSSYEYEFSKYLRKSGFVYNNDYFRDVLYSDIDKTYDGKINCDYKIVINEQIYYFELAGILSNTAHQNCYLTNTKIINSKSKEQYRLKLNEKRNIFERNNLNYFILLSKDMNIENYKKIFDKLNVMAA